ncbi:MAG: hypothetical protein WCK21_07330 [Actinomycetota bacterium]
MTSPITAIQYGNNADLIDVVRRLYPLDGPVLDLTYGVAGGFWKVFRPADLTAFGPTDGVDFTDTLLPVASFRHVVFDPPYVAPGGRSTSTIGAMNDRYGMHTAARTPEAQWETIKLGITEAHRLLVPNGLLWLKVMDYVSSGKVHWFTKLALAALHDSAFELVDEFVLAGMPGPQPRTNRDGSLRRQVHARRAHSVLMIARAQNRTLVRGRRRDCSSDCHLGPTGRRAAGSAS